MHTLIITGIIFTCMAGGTLIGFYFRNNLPVFHTKGSSRDVLITAAGMMGTLVALIVGLLLSSANDTYDAANARLTEGGAKAITLDYDLSLYGKEAEPIRKELRAAFVSGIERIWHSEKAGQIDRLFSNRANEMAELYKMIQALSPKNDSQSYLKTRALQICSDLLQSRWMIVEQSQEKLPMPFLVMLTCWLTVLFAQLGLMASPNRTTISVLFICALSLSSAIFFILELNEPLVGSIKVSSASLEKALQILGNIPQVTHDTRR